ncbi:MAG TPA: hypothetical protein DCE41_09520 [Cytophagales bacterium]|nr:hypothetical protein [Cytophagales bacterium]HAA23959.1 hypothetical protein [Cytophagales bacterium]HAP61571.1 hypothetical protein [Cytophagales bacterium]
MLGLEEKRKKVGRYLYIANLQALNTMRTYYESDLVRIDADPQHHCLVFHWKKGIISTQAYQASLQEGLDIAENFQIRYWVANQRDMGMLSLKNEAWTLDSFFPRLCDSSIELFVLVDSEDEFNVEVTRYILGQPAARKMPLRMAEDVFSALNYVADLQQKPETVLQLA